MSARRRRRSERGYTLAELAVAAVPLAIIALSLFAAFSFTVAFARRGEQRVEAVRQARLALHVMAQELREASILPGAIIVWSRDDRAPQDGVGFLTARADGPGRPFATEPPGVPRWQHAIHYLYDPIRGELRRVATAPSALPALPSGDEGRVLARQVRRFSVTRRGDLLTFSLTVAAAAPGAPSAETVLETAVRPRN